MEILVGLAMVGTVVIYAIERILTHKERTTLVKLLKVSDPRDIPIVFPEQVGDEGFIEKDDGMLGLDAIPSANEILEVRQSRGE